MKRTLIPLLALLWPALTGWGFSAAGAQPRYDITQATIVAEIKPEDNRLEAIADLRLKILDKTNYISLRLNGNLGVTDIEDEAGDPVRFIQDDSDKFEVMLNLVRPQEPGTELALHFQYAGTFSQVEYDFFKELGRSLHALINPEGVELPASALWFPQNQDPFDRSRYEIQVTLPTGLRPLTAGKLTETIDSGLMKTYIFQSEAEVLPPTLLAGRYQIQEHQVGDLRLEAWFLSELPNREEIVKPYAELLKHLQTRWSYQPPGDRLRVVEVSDKSREYFGMEGAVFLTGKEIAANVPETRTVLRKFLYQRWLYPLRLNGPAEIWITEGLSQYTAALYFLENKSSEAFNDTMRLLAVEALKYADSDPISLGYRLGVGSEKYNSVTVAKSAWVFHMLRYLTGDDKFAAILRELDQAGRTTGVDTKALLDITRSVTGSDFEWFFNQWVNSVDLPEFQVEYIVYRQTKGGFQTVGKINQNIAVFQFPLEIKFITKGIDELKVVDVKGESSRLNVETETRPTRIVLDPNFHILRRSGELEIQVLLVKGDEAFENGDFVSATDEYRRAIERDPRNSLAYYKLALVFYEQFNYNSAQNTFRDAVNGNQQPPWVTALCYVYMGKIFDVLGQRQRALAEYNKAINTNDDSRGAVTEAQKYLNQPFTRKRTYLAGEEPAPAGETPPPPAPPGDSPPEAAPPATPPEPPQEAADPARQKQEEFKKTDDTPKTDENKSTDPDQK